jgi:hypothetical protein
VLCDNELQLVGQSNGDQQLWQHNLAADEQNRQQFVQDSRDSAGDA